MRRRLEDVAFAGDLKRGPGGLVDIEFLVQMLQLKHARGNPTLRVPNTLAALRRPYKADLLSVDDFEFFDVSYRLLRTIESRLRLMNSTARDQLPQDPVELHKLASLLHYPEQRRPADRLRERHAANPPPLRGDFRSRVGRKPPTMQPGRDGPSGDVMQRVFPRARSRG